MKNAVTSAGSECLAFILLSPILCFLDPYCCLIEGSLLAVPLWPFLFSPRIHPLLGAPRLVPVC